MTGRSLSVHRVGGLVLIQDLGRTGYAHLGVPRSGALDPEALRLANRLVGNTEGAAGFEILLGEFGFVARSPVRVALTGALLPLTVDGRAEPWGTSLSIPAGATVVVDRGSDALRSWLAVSGGIAVPDVLGSRSTDTLSGLGPRPVAAGDDIPLGPSPPATTGDAAAVPPARPSKEGAELRLLLGPDADLFVDDPRDVLRSRTYTVSSAADRVALRLDGPELIRRDTNEMPSAGLVTGAVQVPGNGLPLVFLADHPTTGGYPVAAVVDDAGVRSCAQLRPGDPVRFV